MLILDTNVISELMRSAGEPQVFQWASRQAPTELFTTSITEAEVFLGIELIAKGKRRDALQAEAEGIFTVDFGNRVLAYDGRAARAYAQIVAHRRSLGRPMSHADAQIAAITQVHGAVLATRDTADFAHCGIRMINPWNT
jgi:predicted nucleic acid-binding protein